MAAGGRRLDQVRDGQASEDSAKIQEDSAKTSADNAKISEQNANASEEPVAEYIHARPYHSELLNRAGARMGQLKWFQICSESHSRNQAAARHAIKLLEECEDEPSEALQGYASHRGVCAVEVASVVWKGAFLG